MPSLRVLVALLSSIVFACGGAPTADPATTPEPAEVGSTPAPAPEVLGTRVMVSVFGDGGSETFTLDVDDPAQRTPFAAGHVVVARAPRGDAFAALNVRDGRPRTEDGFVVLDREGQPRERFPSECLPALIDAHQLVLCEESAPEGAPPRAAIVSVEVDSGERTVLGAAEGQVWDDIPLRVVPEGDAVTFHLRGPETRGLYRAPLAGGGLTEFLRDGYYATFLPSRPMAFALTRTGERDLHQYDYVDGTLRNPRAVPVEGALVAVPLDDDTVLLFVRVGDAWALHRWSLASGQTQVVDDSVSVDDSTAFGPVARVGGDRFVYFGQGADGAEVRIAPVGGGAPQTLVAGGFREGFVVGVVP